MAVSVRIFGGALAGYAAVARVADEVGFHGLWVPDHVVAMSEVATRYPYSDTGRPRFAGATPFGDPLVVLSHLAAVTSRIELGVGVYVLPLRHPLHAARQLMTVQELSGGRLNLGVGVGWKAEEFAALGASFPRRGARAEEAVEVLRRVWSGEPVSFAGEHYAFAELRMSPAPSRPIPVLWGGAGAVSLRRAARMADGWYGPPGSLDASTELVGQVEAALDDAGRDRAGFRIVVRCPEPYDVASVEALLRSNADEVVVNVPRELVEVGAQADWLRATGERLRDRGVRLTDRKAQQHQDFDREGQP
jgi:probable F420-dependent oxidoreductase